MKPAARYFIYLGFACIPLANTVAVIFWSLDESDRGHSYFRPAYAAGNILLIVGMGLVLISPWFTTGSFGKRLQVWLITGLCFPIFMIPMALLFLATGVPVGD